MPRSARLTTTFEFHRAYHALNEFVNTDLSALYLDVLKDRLYTFAPNAKPRRSAQTALWRIAEALTRLIAPILSFTADEVWSLLPTCRGTRVERAPGAVSGYGGDRAGERGWA